MKKKETYFFLKIVILLTIFSNYLKKINISLKNILIGYPTCHFFIYPKKYVKFGNIFLQGIVNPVEDNNYISEW